MDSPDVPGSNYIIDVCSKTLECSSIGTPREYKPRDRGGGLY